MKEVFQSESRVVEKLRQIFPGIVAVYLHGSAAKDTMRADSDIDLALLFEEKKVPGQLQLFLAASEIERAAFRRIDLSVLSTRNTVFAKEVLTNGKLLYCRDPMRHDAFTMYVLSYYAKLNDERADILRAYQVH
ncbi:MAG: nucleotidyltransferase domain-containing protein [Thermodesulfobacteriota bacterium]